MKMKRYFVPGSILSTLFLLSALFLNGCGEPELNKITITPELKSVSVDKTIAFKAKALSEKGEAMPETSIAWSVDPGDVGEIDSSGNFTAAKPGKVVIKASSQGVSGKMQVVVKAKKVADIKVAPEKEKALPGSLIKAEGKLLADDGTSAGFNTIRLYSETDDLKLSSEKIDVDEKGVFSFEATLGSKPGRNVIFLESGSVKKRLVIQGTRIVKLAIKPGEKTFEVNQVVDFQALGFDKYGKSKPVTVKWTLSGEKAELDKKGQVKMISTGDAVIVAEYKDLILGSPFSIVPGRLATIEIDPEKLSLKAGQSGYLNTIAKNRFGHILAAKPSWKIDKDLGKIESDGMFMARKQGTGTITAYIGDVSNSIPVKVEPGFLADIEFKLEKISLKAGESMNLEAQGLDAFGNHVPVEPDWSLDRAMGRIDHEQSKLTVYQSGKGSIRAQKGNILKAVEINVLPAELARFEIVPANSTITAGTMAEFKVKGFDRFNNPVNVDPELKLHDELGNLAEDMTFKAVKAGNTILEASQGDIRTNTSVAVVPGKMVKAALSPDTPVTLKAGEVQEFKIFGQDELKNTVHSLTTWKLIPADLGTINIQGVLTGKKTGTGRLVAEIKDLKTNEIITLENQVEIENGEPVRIEIDPEQASLSAGEKRSFQAIVFDKFGNTINKSVEWKLENEFIGSISKNGIFKSVKSGEWDIIAGLENVRARAKVKVSAGEIAYNNISPPQLSLKAGETQKLEAVSEDRFGNVIASEVVWKVFPAKLGHVTSENIFVAQKQGKGYLTAVANDIAQKLPIEVKKGPLARIEILMTEKTLSSGSSITLGARGFDPGDNQVELQAEWDIKPDSIAQINEKGVLTAVKTGTGSVTAKARGVKASHDFKVVPGKAARIKVLNAAPVEITAGEKIKLDIQAFDANDNQISAPDFAFQVEDQLGSVLGDNEFSAHLVGKGNINVVLDKAQAQIPVKVAAAAVNLIEVQPGQTTIASGSEMTFKATGYDQEGNQVELKPGWTVINGIGSITEDGRFTAHTVGEGWVTCQMADISGLSKIRVKPGPVSRITVTPEKLDVKAGQKIKFKGTAYDAQGNVNPVDLVWSLEPDSFAGTVKQNGTFIAARTGKGELQAASDKIKGKADIQVVPAEMKELVIEQSSLELISGEKAQLNINGKDSYGNTIKTDADWSVEPESLASFTASGVITAVKAGTGKVSAVKGDFSAKMDFTVKPGPLAVIKIKGFDKTLKGGKNYQFEAAGFDSGGNQIEFDPKWAVTKHIGSIDKKTGLFKASKAGKGSIEVYDKGVVDSMNIEVVPGDLSQLFLDPNPVVVKSAYVQEFKVTGMDVARNKVKVPELAWKVLGNIGFLDNSNKFTATRQGSGKVMVQIDSVQAESYVTVIAGDPSMNTTRLRAEPANVKADGKDFSKIIIQIRDKYNNPVPEADIKLVSSRQTDVIYQPAKTDAAGRTTGTVSSEVSGDSTITALINKNAVRDNVHISFK